MRGALPQPVEEALTALLADRAGAPTAIHSARAISGGDINKVWQVTTGQGRYLVKHHPRAPTGFFASEARGLELLAGAGAVRVPRIYGVSEEPPLLVMEWIDAGGDRTFAAAALGAGLARQHRATAERFGLGEPFYLATLPLPGGWFETWPACWRAFLEAMGRHADHRGCMPPERSRRLLRLLDRLERWVSEDAGGPALLHGDLWGGNWMVTAGGEPVLFDPAAFYGSREVDLAMTELFGGFPEPFYRAYREACPLPPGYEERRPLYQLYYLLAHVALFGESYGSGVDRILVRYTGA